MVGLAPSHVVVVGLTVDLGSKTLLIQNKLIYVLSIKFILITVS